MARLRDLIFFVTRRCNQRCRTCFYAAEFDRPPATDRPELTLAEIDAVAGKLGRLDSLLISGGEPFLRDDLVEICATFRRRCRIAAIHLPSNGMLPERIATWTQNILRRLPGLAVTLSLSLDGPEAVHDEIRGTPGSFRRTVETARLLAGLRARHPALKLYIITVVTAQNLDSILPLAEWVKGYLPVDGHGPSPLRGHPRDPGLRPPSAASWRALAEELLPYHRHWLEQSGRSHLRAVVAYRRVRYLYALYGHVLAGGLLPFRCPAGGKIAVLEADGDVRRCELAPPVGNVRAAGFDLSSILHSATGRVERSCACTHACFLERGLRRRLAPLLAPRWLRPEAHDD